MPTVVCSRFEATGSQWAKSYRDTWRCSSDVTTILVGYDESPQAEAALKHALDAFPDAEIVEVHATDSTEFVSEGDESGQFLSKSAYEVVKGTAKRTLAEADSVADRHGREIRTEELLGDPGQAPVRYARGHDINQLVTGGHGRTGVSRVLLGSVSEKVVRRSAAPVTDMRDRPEEPATTESDSKGS